MLSPHSFFLCASRFSISPHFPVIAQSLRLRFPPVALPYVFPISTASTAPTAVSRPFRRLAVAHEHNGWYFIINGYAVRPSFVSCSFLPEWFCRPLVCTSVAGLYIVVKIPRLSHSHMQFVIRHFTALSFEQTKTIMSTLLYAIAMVRLLLDRPFCERSILCFVHVSFFFFPNSLFPTSANRNFRNFSTWRGFTRKRSAAMPIS